jgi:hypothetical protein
MKRILATFFPASLSVAPPAFFGVPVNSPEKRENSRLLV